jgi:hypothetical protein
MSERRVWWAELVRLVRPGWALLLWLMPCMCRGKVEGGGVMVRVG